MQLSAEVPVLQLAGGEEAVQGLEQSICCSSKGLVEGLAGSPLVGLYRVLFDPSQYLLNMQPQLLAVSGGTEPFGQFAT